MKARKLLDKEDFDYDHFTRLTSTGIKADYNTIAQFAEDYHQEQLKLLNIDNVSKSLEKECTNQWCEDGVVMVFGEPHDCNVC